MEIAILIVLGILVLAAVAWPLLKGARGHHTDAQEFAVEAPPSKQAAVPEPTSASPGPSPSGPAAKPAASRGPSAETGLEGEIDRYRTAVTAGTVCKRCGEANPADAKFCRECGKALPASEAQEFAK